jgi:hypothetical protein
MHRIMALVVCVLALVGCREERVKSYAEGTTTILGPAQIVVVRNARDLETLGIHYTTIRYPKEFAVVLLMGPHKETGWSQLIESIRPNKQRIRIVAFEHQSLESEPTREYRTYTLWIVPNSVYRRGSVVDVVTPSGDPVASTTLR